MLLQKRLSKTITKVLSKYIERSYNISKKDAKGMVAAYEEAKKETASKKLPPSVSASAVFTCNELNMKSIEVYGFDYDYTISCYKNSMLNLLFELAKHHLVDGLKYPKEILNLEFDQYFAIRGLHYDISNGVLLKLDCFLQIQLGSVYKGLHPLSKEEVLKLYNALSLPNGYLEAKMRIGSFTLHEMEAQMFHLPDLFSVPEVCLICNVINFFEMNSFDYHPKILWMDIRRCMGVAHELMHKIVAGNVSEYLTRNPSLLEFFQRLVDNGKKLFLITNSPFDFVDAGMKFLLGEKWIYFFEVIIVQAKKPVFFIDITRPFRKYDERGGFIWNGIKTLEKGVIYAEGNIKRLEKLTGWKSPHILYFGDHPYSDLADVTLEYSWRTAAIIQELNYEIAMLNQSEFKKTISWLQRLTVLIESHEVSDTPEEQEILKEWLKERSLLTHYSKVLFNHQFGSVFRTHSNPSYFSRRLFRYADIYTSNLTNLLGYPLNHTFYPRRGVMPHESIV